MEPKRSGLPDLESLRFCGWAAASKDAGELAIIGGATERHGAGNIVVTSCQRVEVYHRSACDCDAEWRASGAAALLRLAEVAAGLHSLVLGEAQILGQVRTGLAVARPELRALGDIALAAARAVRAETAFAAHSGHLLDRALSLSGVPAQGRIAVIGAGSMGKLVTQRALELGFSDVVAVGRKRPSGPWCEGPHTSTAALADLTSIGAVDVLVSCLGASAAPLDRSGLPEVRTLAVDLGTPYNLTGDLGVPTLTVAAMVAEAAQCRHSDGRRAALQSRLRELVEHRVRLAATDSRTELGRLRLEVERVRKREAERIRRLHPEISLQTIETITRSLVNQIFHGPTQRLRELDDQALVARFTSLFVAGPAPELEACP